MPRLALIPPWLSGAMSQTCPFFSVPRYLCFYHLDRGVWRTAGSHSLDEPPLQFRPRPGAEGSQEEPPPPRHPVPHAHAELLGRHRPPPQRDSEPASGALLAAPPQGGEGRRRVWGKKRVRRAPVPRSGGPPPAGSLDMQRETRALFGWHSRNHLGKN